MKHNKGTDMTYKYKTVTSCPWCGSFAMCQDAAYGMNTEQYDLYEETSCGECDFRGKNPIETTVPIEFNCETDSLPAPTTT